MALKNQSVHDDCLYSKGESEHRKPCLWCRQLHFEDRVNEVFENMAGVLEIFTGSEEGDSLAQYRKNAEEIRLYHKSHGIPPDVK